MNKPSMLKSIFGLYCPRCRKGKLFSSPLFRLKIYDMPERCTVCQQKFDIEPGFYWGAMYVAYMLSSGVLLATAGISILVFKMPVFYLWFALGFVGLLFLPYIARLARSIWIHIFVSYRAD
ncbi:MAG: DUF983 domain-containing protein [Saprospiraceae bacterium]|nr:DUF983 domain-containing protein [Saprospiraceae bacterium]